MPQSCCLEVPGQSSVCRGPGWIRFRLCGHAAHSSSSPSALQQESKKAGFAAVQPYSQKRVVGPLHPPSGTHQTLSAPSAALSGGGCVLSQTHGHYQHFQTGIPSPDPLVPSIPCHWITPPTLLVAVHLNVHLNSTCRSLERLSTWHKFLPSPNAPPLKISRNCIHEHDPSDTLASGLRDVLISPVILSSTRLSHQLPRLYPQCCYYPLPPSSPFSTQQSEGSFWHTHHIPQFGVDSNLFPCLSWVRVT